MSIALYRKYRSKSLDEIIGQAHITDLLKLALDHNKIVHAYLFTGPRGVGKTSIARILAHSINKTPIDDSTNSLDIIEIDAASNNSVEDIRELTDKAQIAPINAAKKIYIIDEVHMLSKSAFNALLKTLEEPPKHVIFILATTNVEKLPNTIISRTQRFDFNLIEKPLLERHLSDIAKRENIAISDEGISLIALQGEGSLRDSITILDQLSSLSQKNKIDTKLIERTFGLASSRFIEQLINAYLNNDLAQVVSLLNDATIKGLQPKIIANQIARYIQEHILESPSLINLLDQVIKIDGSSFARSKLLIACTSFLDRKFNNEKINAARNSSPVNDDKSKIKGDAHNKDSNDLKKTNLKNNLPGEKISNEIENNEFSINDILEEIKKNNYGLYSILKKCKIIVNDNKATIHTNNKFYKTKIDSSKNRQILFDLMHKKDKSVERLEIVSSVAPSSNKHTQMITSIMGGGEEVGLD